MSTQILATKLYIPASHPANVSRQRLIKRLSTGLHGKLTLVSAPAGFGKTTLVTEWIASDECPVAWLSLDESDNDPAQFLTYLVAALQTISPQLGTGIMTLLEAPQPSPIESLLTPLLNEIAAVPHEFLMVLDDYHVLDSTEIDSALTFLIDNQPPQMHLVITTREDPRLPLARLRARGQLNELRVADLRFTPDEAAEFLNQRMGLAISPEDIVALEQRTEGWIAGLQLASISMQGQQDRHQFIQSFTGSHHFVLDYLVEEVLEHQRPHIHNFLLKTSILDRMCAPLCDAILQDENHNAIDLLESVRQANLFLIPLDNERHWFRYHHLFGDLLRKRLVQVSDVDISVLHIRASVWYEANGFEVQAFQHAATVNDIDRAERIIHGTGVPLYFRGIAWPVLHWLNGLSAEVLNAHPSLWLIYAWTLMAVHRSTQIEDKLQAAEAVLTHIEQDDTTRDLLGQIAAIRSMEAAIFYKSEEIIVQAQQALEYLHPDNLYIRTTVTRALAIAYQYQGERRAAREAYLQAIEMSEQSDNVFVNILSTTGLGIIQLADNQLYEAAESFHRVFDLVGDPDQPMNCVAYLRLARIHYEWNDLEAAQAHCEQGVNLAQKIESIDSSAAGEIFLARLKLAQGDVAGASAMLTEVERVVRQRNFVRQIPVAAALRVLLYLHAGEVQQAEQIAQEHDLPLSKARVSLAQDDPAEALAILTRYRQQMEAKDWHDERLKAMVLQALAHHQQGDTESAMVVIGEVLSVAVLGAFVRTFLDEGQPMKRLLSGAVAHGVMPDYVNRLLSAFAVHRPVAQPLIEPLSDRELEILALVANGLSNRQISERLFVALSTVKGHNQNIFDKLQVKRRTEAVARARELGLIS